jgi:hypothetical protein
MSLVTLSALHPLNQEQPVVVAKPHKGKAATVRKVSRVTRKLRVQALGGIALCAAAVAGITVSLTDLAEGLHLVTAFALWKCWALAVVVDYGFLALKFSLMACAHEKTRKAVERQVSYLLWGLVAMSSIMNAFAFSAQAEGWHVYVAVILGLVLPFGILGFSNVGAKLLIATRAD